MYFPQNSEYTKTSEMVHEIGITSGNIVYMSRALIPIVFLLAHIPGKISKLINKAFGNQNYNKVLSTYDGLDYQNYRLRESIILTETSNEVK